MQPRDELITEWLTKADDDLRLAQLALDDSPPVCWGAAFHAQQAVEKLVKALLTHHGVEFSKTHAIDYLMDLCAAAEPRSKELREEAAKLTDFAVEPRYPFPRQDPSETDARGALQTARQVREFVRAVLPGHD